MIYNSLFCYHFYMFFVFYFILFSSDIYLVFSICLSVLFILFCFILSLCFSLEVLYLATQNLNHAAMQETLGSLDMQLLVSFSDTAVKAEQQNHVESYSVS